MKIASKQKTRSSHKPAPAGANQTASASPTDAQSAQTTTTSPTAANSYRRAQNRERFAATGQRHNLPTNDAPSGANNVIRAGDLNPRRDLRPNPEMRGGFGDSVAPQDVRIGREESGDTHALPVYEDIGRTLQSMTQIDDNRGVNRGGHDTVRCGSASLTAGLVATGDPARMDRAAGALRERVSTLRGMANGDSGRAGDSRGQAAFRARTDLGHAAALLDRLDARGGAANWTQADLSQFQEAVHSTATADELLATHVPPTPGHVAYAQLPDQERGIALGTVRQYRDMLWGGDGIEANGRRLDINFMETAQGGGHFVLTQDGETQARGQSAGQPVVYDPWPGEDGTAYYAPSEPPGSTHPAANIRLIPYDQRPATANQRRARDPDVQRMLRNRSRGDADAARTPDELREQIRIAFDGR